MSGGAYFVNSRFGQRYKIIGLLFNYHVALLDYCHRLHFIYTWLLIVLYLFLTYGETYCFPTASSLQFLQQNKVSICLPMPSCHHPSGS